jgi:hypothetical protein
MTPKQVKGKNWLQLYIRLVNDTNKELLRLLYNDNIVSIVDNYDNAIKKNTDILIKSLRMHPEEVRSIFNIVDDNAVYHRLVKFLVEEYYRYILKDIIRYNIKKPGKHNRSDLALTLFRDRYVLLDYNHIDIDNSIVRKMDIYKQLKTPDKYNILRVNTLVDNMLYNDPKLSEYYKSIKDKDGLFRNTDPESIEISRFYDVYLRMYLNYFGKYIYAAKIAIAKLYDIYKNANEIERNDYLVISRNILNAIMTYTDGITSDMDYNNSSFVLPQVFTNKFVLEDIREVFPDYDNALNSDIKERRGF